MTVVVLMLALGGVGVLQAAIWIPLVHSRKRKSATFRAHLAEEMAAAGETFVIHPEQAVYRGCTGPYGKVRGNGMILLTNRRLVFRKMTGGEVDVPRDNIVGTRRSAVFLASRVGGATHLVISTNDPAEVGFVVNDLHVWERALGTHLSEGSGRTT